MVDEALLYSVDPLLSLNMVANAEFRAEGGGEDPKCRESVRDIDEIVSVMMSPEFQASVSSRV